MITTDDELVYNYVKMNLEWFLKNDYSPSAGVYDDDLIFIELDNKDIYISEFDLFIYSEQVFAEQRLTILN